MVRVLPLEIRFLFNGKESIIYPTLLVSGDETILVDTGYPGQMELLQEEAAKQGVNLNNLTKIVLTHHDFDHVGSLQALKQQYKGAIVMATPVEAAYISGKEKSFRLRQAEAIYTTLPEEQKAAARQFEALLKSVPFTDVDVVVADGEAIDKAGEVMAISTPGHTEGHLSLYIPSLKTMVAGDALTFNGTTLALANPQYAYNLQQAGETARHIMNMELEQVICYHGGICHQPRKEQFQLTTDNIHSPQ